MGLPVGAIAQPLLVEVALWALETEVEGKNLIGFGSVTVVGTMAHAVTDTDTAPRDRTRPTADCQDVVFTRTEVCRRYGYLVVGQIIDHIDALQKRST